MLFIYRPEYYQIDQLDDGTPTSGLAVISVAKHRNGPLGEKNLKFTARYARFSDYDSVEPELGTGDGLLPEKLRIVQSRMNDMKDLEEDDTPF